MSRTTTLSRTTPATIGGEFEQHRSTRANDSQHPETSCSDVPNADPEKTPPETRCQQSEPPLDDALIPGILEQAGHGTRGHHPRNGTPPQATSGGPAVPTGQDPTEPRPGSNRAPAIRYTNRRDPEDRISLDGTLGADSPSEKESTKLRLEAVGGAAVYVHHRLSGGQKRWLEKELDDVARLCGVPYPEAMRAGLIHVLFCYNAYRYRYDRAGVPMPWYVWARLALRYDDAIVKNTEDVWKPLEAAGLIEGLRFRGGLCRRFVLNPEVAVAFAKARGTTKTRYDAMTGKPTRATNKTKLTYNDHDSWKDTSTLMYDVLTYWRGARCLANKPAMEAHLATLEKEAECAQDVAQATGLVLGLVKRMVRERAPYGPLTPEAYAPIATAKDAHRRARRAANSAMSAYAQDQHCWGVACDQDMRPAKGFPPGIVEFTPAYEVQMVSGRLTFIGGGPQGLSRRGKAAFYSGIREAMADRGRELVNYDINGSQTNKLIEEFEDAIAAGAELDISVLTDYEGKDVLSKRYGVSRDVFKQAEHAPKFGAGFPHQTFEVAWRLAGKDAYDTVEEYGWGHCEHRFRTWEERVAGELKTMAGIAYAVATDPAVRGLSDPEEVYALLKEVYGPMAREVKKWRRWLIERYWKAHGRPGGGGRFVEGPCGFAFNIYDFDEKEREAKFATNRLQGGEACFIHHLTLLGAKYGYEALANEHDGLVVLGTIPEAAVEEARRLSGFRSAEIEPKPFWEGADVGLPAAPGPLKCTSITVPVQGVVGDETTDDASSSANTASERPTHHAWTGPRPPVHPFAREPQLLPGAGLTVTFWQRKQRLQHRPQGSSRPSARSSG